MNKIYTGEFTSSDIGMLFIWLRPVIGNNNLVWDLANFVAHNDERDRGVSFEHLHKYVTNFIEVSEKGGTIYGLLPIFDKEKVVKELNKVLDNLDLDINKSKIIEQKDKITDCLLELIEETEFRFDDPRIIKCFLKRDGQKMMFCLNLNLKGPRIITSPAMTIQSSLFD